MSRTDVHVPYWVIDRDPAWRREFREVHIHHDWVWHSHDTKTRKLVAHQVTFVGCDLAVFLAGGERTGCRMEYAGHRNVYCGCNLCTGRLARHTARRQERAMWRQQRARILAAVDRMDVDVPPLRGSTW